MATIADAPKAMTHLPRQQQDFKIPPFENGNSFLGDVCNSKDPDKPIVCGFYRQEKGTPLVYNYTYHEMKIVLEGTFEITDETGKTIRASKGDVLYFQAGSSIKFTCVDGDYALGFFCGQREPDGF